MSARSSEQGPRGRCSDRARHSRSYPEVGDASEQADHPSLIIVWAPSAFADEQDVGLGGQKRQPDVDAALAVEVVDPVGESDRQVWSTRGRRGRVRIFCRGGVLSSSLGRPDSPLSRTEVEV
ncbi:hypothetical protein EF834_04020 [Rhodococcus spongiicola]|uniref:Uncharacterized protein n=1 Tax=Rhodococcus spongiicola TaxID=2487352 RepID=A0A3S3BQ38_9NOCA|nr:hypothetical protein EF834_04020 [Rhodococcus spongiicola]